MLREPDPDELDTRRRALLAALAAGGGAALAGCPDDVETPVDEPTPTETRTDTRTEEPTPESVTFEGLSHTSLGGASLDAGDDRLAVSGVEDGGGVRVDFGSVEATALSLAPVDLGGQGRRFDVAGTGTVGGESGRPIGSVSLRGTGETIEAAADYADVGAAGVRVQVVDGEEVVGETVVEGGGLVATVEPGPNGLPRLSGCDKDIVPDPPFPPLPCYVPVWDRRCRVVASDGTELVGDRLRLLAEEPERGIEAIESFDLTASGIQEFGLTDETVGVFGNDHGALGGATLDARSLEPRLTVADVGSGGDGGVRADFGGVGASDVRFEPVDLGGQGRRFDVAGTGTVDGEAGRSIGRISLRGTGETIEAVADYSDVGAEEVRIQVVDGEEVVGETVVPGGDVVATVEPGPDGLPQLSGCDKDVLPDPPFPPLPCYVPVWDRRCTVVAGDGTELVGDRLRLLAEGSQRSLEAIGGFDLTAAGVPEFAVTDESTESVEEGGQSLVFEGLRHSSVGDASLDVAEGQLLVGGVEDGDGVRVDFGSVEATDLSLAPVDLGERGRRFDVAGTGTVAGSSGRSIGNISLRGTGETIEAVADYSDVGAAGVRVQVVRRGDVVGETVVEGGGVVATVEPGPDGNGLPLLSGCDKDIVPDPPFPPFPCYVPVWDRLGTVVAADGTELVGDRLRLLAEEPERGIEAIETFDLTGTGLSEFRLTDETIGAFGNDHGALGAATLDARDGGSALTVGNLGREGTGGVRADFGDVAATSVSLAPVDLGEQGRRFDVAGTGTVDDRPEQSIGRISLRGTGETIEAVADYSDVGAKEVRVQVVRRGDVVGETVVEGGGVVATVEPGPDGNGLPLLSGCDKDLRPDPPLPPFPCYAPWWDGRGTVVASDGTELVGDRLRLLAEEPESSLQTIGAFDLTAAGVGKFGLVGESTEPLG